MSAYPVPTAGQLPAADSGRYTSSAFVDVSDSAVGLLQDNAHVGPAAVVGPFDPEEDFLGAPRTFKRVQPPPTARTLYEFWTDLLANHRPDRLPTVAEIGAFTKHHILESPFKWLWASLAIGFVAMILFVAFAGQLFPFFVKTADSIRDLGVLGMICMAAIIMLASLPPMIGYGTLNYVSGFIFGLGGFIPSYLGALSGAALCWVITRLVLGDNYGETVKKTYPQWGVMERAIQQRGTRLLVLIRLAPYPYSIMNVLLASMRSIPLSSYLLTTAVALPKLIIHVYLGSTVHDLADITKTSSPAKFLALIFFGGLGILLFVYLGYIVGREMQEYGSEPTAGVARDGDGDSIVVDDFDDPHSEQQNEGFAELKLNGQRDTLGGGLT